jgi:polysaccharide biosynthesis/export protein
VTLLRLLLAFLLFAPPAAAFAAAPKDIVDDLAYYRRTADKQKLGANDRLYILHRLKDKYLESGLDLAELEAEIAKQDAARSSPSAPPAPVPPRRAAPEPPAARASDRPGLSDGAARAEKKGPLLEGLRLEKKKDGAVTLVLALSEPVVPNAVRVDDPARPDRPRLVIGLPGTRHNLSAVSRDVRWDEGPLASASAEQTGGGVRVEVELNGEAPYRVLRSDRNVLVEARPAPGPWASPGAARALRNEARAGTPQAATVGASDVLDIRVEPSRELSRQAPVRADGTIDFPLAGPLFVRGMRLDWVEKTLAQKLSPYVPKPRVTARIAAGFPAAAEPDIVRDDVFVIGEVVHPGHYPFQPGATLLDTVSRAGGVTAGARPGRAKIFRQTSLRREVFDVDLARVLAGQTERDVALQRGDIVLVPAKPLYSGAGAGWLPWLTLAALIAAIVVAA